MSRVPTVFRVGDLVFWSESFSDPEGNKVNVISSGTVWRIADADIVLVDDVRLHSLECEAGFQGDFSTKVGAQPVLTAKLKAAKESWYQK